MIINQPGDAPTVMNFQDNLGYIMSMAGFVPSAEFYAPDPNPDLVGTVDEGVLIRQQVLGTYETPEDFPVAPVEIVSEAVTAAAPSEPYSYDVNATAFPGPITYSLVTAPAGMTIDDDTGLITWTTPAEPGTYDVSVQAATASGSDTQAFQISTLVVIEPEFLVRRIAGPDRYATAVAASKLRFPNPVAANTLTVYVATGSNFPDALAAAPAAGSDGGSLLLVRQDGIPKATRDELTRLRPARIYLVGGTAAISPQVQTALGAYAPVVQRLQGADRYGTAAAVSTRFGSNVGDVFIVTGTNFPDAVSAGPAATLQDSPILTVPRQLPLPKATRDALTRLSPTRIFVIGGTAAISEAMRTELRKYTDSKTAASVIRLAGANRYITNEVVTRRFWEGPESEVMVATGMNFPDALVAGTEPLPMHLVQKTVAPPSALAEMARLQPSILDVFGGTAAITDGVINQLTSVPLAD